jgi:hypothetical protein
MGGDSAAAADHASQIESANHRIVEPSAHDREAITK